MDKGFQYPFPFLCKYGKSLLKTVLWPERRGSSPFFYIFALYTLVTVIWVLGMKLHSREKPVSLPEGLPDPGRSRRLTLLHSKASCNQQSSSSSFSLNNVLTVMYRRPAVKMGIPDGFHPFLLLLHSVHKLWHQNGCPPHIDRIRSCCHSCL